MKMNHSSKELSSKIKNLAFFEAIMQDFVKSALIC